MSYAGHQHESQRLVARCAVVTLSDTRTEATDSSGRLISELLAADGHVRTQYHLIHDEPAELRPLLDRLLDRDDVDVILCTGGTGVSRRDQTIDVIEGRLSTVLPGFGELFRMLSFSQIGSGAMLSRAVGGVAAGKLLLAMPGSTAAVELAMNRLILPELRHLLHELRK